MKIGENRRKKDRKLQFLNFLSIFFILTTLLLSSTVNPMLFQLGPANSQPNEVNSIGGEKNFSITSSYVNHPHISIFNNSAFAQFANSGDGTKDNPWIISNYNFTDTGKTKNIISGWLVSTYLVFVANTSDHFILENNNFVFNMVTGIVLINVANGTVINNNFQSSNGGAILVKKSQNLEISDNHIGNVKSRRYIDDMYDGHGLILIDTLNVTATNNVIVNPKNSGIFLENSYNNRIINNTIGNIASLNNVVTYRSNGIYLTNSNLNLIDTNVIFSQSELLFLNISVNNTITNNTLTTRPGNKGLRISGHLISYVLQTNVSNNTVNGLPLVFLQNSHNKTIDYTFYQLIVFNSTSISINNIIFINNGGVEISFSEDIKLIGNSFINSEDFISELRIRYSTSINFSNNVGEIEVKPLETYNSTFANNSIDGKFTLDNSNYNSITNNTFVDVPYFRIEIRNSNNNLIEQNTFDNIHTDRSNIIKLSGSEFNQILYNNFINSAGVSLSLSNSPSNSIIGNNFTSGGITFGGDLDYDQTSISQNLVGGKPFVMLKGLDLFLLDYDVGQLIIFDSTNIEIKNVKFTAPNPIVIRSSYYINFHDNVLNDSYINNNLIIWDSNNIVIDNNIFNNGFKGIQILNSNNNTFTNNVFIELSISISFENGYTGNNIITGNSFSGKAIHFDFNSYDVHDYLQKEVSNNFVNDLPLMFIQNVTNLVIEGDIGQIVLINSTGIDISNIQFTSGTGIQILHSKLITVKNNNFEETDRAAMEIKFSLNINITNNIISNSSYGILVDFSDYNSFFNNIFMYNGIGIDFYQSYNNSLKFNNFIFSSSYALKLFFSSNNSITMNNFVENNIGNIQVSPWKNNSFSYNYWSDWISPDENEDGIVDQPYELSSSVMDLYPVTTPYQNPVIIVTVTTISGMETTSVTSKMGFLDEIGIELNSIILGIIIIAFFTIIIIKKRKS